MEVIWDRKWETKIKRNALLSAINCFKEKYVYVTAVTIHLLDNASLHNLIITFTSKTSLGYELDTADLTLVSTR